MILIFNLVVSI